MQKRLMRETGVVLICIALLAACTTAPTGALDGVRLDTYVSEAELRLPGDSVVVRVVVTNTTSEPRTIPWIACPPPFEIRDNSGASLAPDDLRLCTTIAARRTLAPGESAELTGVWRGEMRAEPRGGLSAPAGTYQVYGRLLGTALVSAPLTVVVRTR